MCGLCFGLFPESSLSFPWLGDPLGMNSERKKCSLRLLDRPLASVFALATILKYVIKKIFSQVSRVCVALMASVYEVPPAGSLYHVTVWSEKAAVLDRI